VPSATPGGRPITLHPSRPARTIRRRWAEGLPPASRRRIENWRFWRARRGIGAVETGNAVLEPLGGFTALRSPVCLSPPPRGASAFPRRGSGRPRGAMSRHESGHRAERGRGGGRGRERERERVVWSEGESESSGCQAGRAPRAPCPARTQRDSKIRARNRIQASQAEGNPATTPAPCASGSAASRLDGGPKMMTAQRGRDGFGGKRFPRRLAGVVATWEPVHDAHICG
jgi:hypothetical protein